MLNNNLEKQEKQLDPQQKAFKALVEFYGDDLCREAKNHLHECLMVYANHIVESEQVPLQEEHDHFITMHMALYDYFDDLDSVFAEDLVKTE